jgi:hypothetical protein
LKWSPTQLHRPSFNAITTPLHKIRRRTYILTPTGHVPTFWLPQGTYLHFDSHRTNCHIEAFYSTHRNFLVWIRRGRKP